MTVDGVGGAGAGRRAPWLWLGLGLAALVPFLALVWRFDFVCDDAYITFRYARNLARGAGLVFNPGVTPPVEGYSEPLWAVLMAGGLALGLSPVVLARVLSVASGAALVLGVAWLLQRRVARSATASAGALAFLVLCTPLAVWSTGGMATASFALAVLALFALTWAADEPAPGWALGLVGAACALLRADGAWWVAWTLGPALVLGHRRGQRRLRDRALVGAAIAAAVFALHVAWRWHTYGDWLPNTARVKVGLSGRSLARGGDYLAHGLLTFPGLALASAAALLARERAERRVGPALLLVLATAGHAVLASGDFMAFARFLVPAVPFAALLLGAGLAGLEARGPAGRVAGATLALVCAVSCLLPAWGLHVTPTAWRGAFAFRYNRPDAARRSELDQWRRMDFQAREWVDLGRALKLVSQPGDSIVYGAVGAIGYYSGLVVYDMNGLVTREVAEREPLPGRRSPGHDKTVPPEFFQRYRPTYLNAFWYPGTAEELARDPDPALPRGPGVVLEPVPLPPDRSPRPDQLLVVWRGDG